MLNQPRKVRSQCFHRNLDNISVSLESNVAEAGTGIGDNVSRPLRAPGVNIAWLQIYSLRGKGRSSSSKVNLTSVYGCPPRQLRNVWSRSVKSAL